MSNDFVLTIISWELLNLSLYLFVGVNATVEKQAGKSLGASLKYFLLGALASGLLLAGILIFYAYTGSTNYEVVSTIISYVKNEEIAAENYHILDVGSCLILGAILFKLGTAPVYNYVVD